MADKQQEEYDYDRDLEINKDDLRRECSNQPKRLMKYIKELARRSKEVKYAKEDLDKTRSRLTKEIIKASDKKPLVSEIDAYVIEHKDYQQDRNDLADLEYEYDILRGAVDAFRQRKDMIQETIKLLHMSYFSAVEIPSTPDKSGLGEQMKEEAAANTRDAVNNKRRARRK